MTSTVEKVRAELKTRQEAADKNLTYKSHFAEMKVDKLQRLLYMLITAFNLIDNAKANQEHKLAAELASLMKNLEDNVPGIGDDYPEMTSCKGCWTPIRKR